MDLHELLSLIANTQELHIATEKERILYSGTCADIPWSVLREAEEMVVSSVTASGSRLLILMSECEPFAPFGFLDNDDEDEEDDDFFDGDMPFR